MQEGDAGSYSCTAVNSAGRAVRRLSLSIHTLPTFTHLPTDITLSRGERLELVCAAVGSPQPRVSWMANGQLLTGTWAGAGAEAAELGGESDPGATLVPPFRVPGVPARLAVRGCNQLIPNHTFGGLHPADGVSGQSGRSILRREAATPTDSGTYVCHAENSAGAIRATAFVSVRGRCWQGNWGARPAPLLCHPFPFPRGTHHTGGCQHLPGGARWR